MGRVISGLTTALLLLVFLPAGCGLLRGGSAGALVRKLVSVLEETAELLATIGDEASAHEASGRLQELAAERQQIHRQLGALRAAGKSEQIDAQVTQRYGDRLAECMRSIHQERARIRQIPQAWAVVASEVARLASGAGLRPHGQSVEQLRARLSSQFGEDRVGVLLVDNVPGDVTRHLFSRVKQLGGVKSLTATTSDGTCKIAFAPVTDIRALVPHIDFGNVVEVDEAKRLVRVEADASRLPEPLTPQITDVQNPDFYRRNCADLSCDDRLRIAAAARRLVQAEPRECRQEITAAAERLLQQEDASLRTVALQLLVRYSDIDCVPVLNQCLSDPSPHVRHETLRRIGDLADPRSVSPVCKRLLAPEDRIQARRCLERIGSIVEETVILGLQHSDPDVVIECCNVLQIVGTEKSLPALAELLEHGSSAVKDHAFSAGRTIHKRVNKNAGSSEAGPIR